MLNCMYLLVAAESVSSGVVGWNGGMSAKDWIAILVPALVTVLGFVFTYFSLRKNFIKEMEKRKSNLALEKMSTVPFETLDLYETIIAPTRIQKQMKLIEGKDNISKSEQVAIQKMKTEIIEAEDTLYGKMSNLYNTIYAYGSIDAIRIVSSMQKFHYKLQSDAQKEEIYIVMVHMILLSSQVKKDVTNIIVNPELWFEMKITDYEANKGVFDPLVNKVVEELGLDEKFKILS